MSERGAMSIFFEKPELKLAVLDQVMYTQKRFQTRADWEIEVKARDARHTNYAIALATFTASYVFTAPTMKIKRMFGPPDTFVIPPWRAAKDAIMNTILGMNGIRPQATGFYRQFCCFAPTFLVFSCLNHYQESVRLASYLALKDKTAFGELASHIDNGDFDTTKLTATMDDASAKVIRTTNNKMELNVV